MKRIVTTIVSALALAIIPLSGAFALTGVSGNVSNNGKDVSGASITATCKTASGTSSTQSNGDYFVVLTPDGVCKAGDTVTVNASQGAATGQSTGTFSNYGADVNIALVNVSVPEFALITGVGAVLLGGGAFMIIRRRNLRAIEQ
jgi:hypothetical protein